MRQLVIRTAMLGLAGAAVLAAFVPSKAEAYWVRRYWGPRFYVGVPYFVPRPVIVAPAPVVVAPPVVYARPAARWFAPFYDYRGYYHPGHWG